MDVHLICTISIFAAPIFARTKTKNQKESDAWLVIVLVAVAVAATAAVEIFQHQFALAHIIVCRNMSFIVCFVYKRYSQKETAIGIGVAHIINVARSVVAILFADNILIRCLFGSHCLFRTATSNPTKKKTNRTFFWFVFRLFLLLFFSYIVSISIDDTESCSSQLNLLFRTKTFRPIIIKLRRLGCTLCASTDSHLS